MTSVDGNDLPSLETYENEVPRWVQIPMGVVLGLFTLLCGLASLSLLPVPNKQAPVLAVIIGLILLSGACGYLRSAFV